MTNDLDRALIALRVSRDHGHGAVLNDAEVPALLAELDRLTRERDEAREERDDLRVVLMRHGFVPCDIPACNCGSWHARFGYPERMQEIKDALDEAGHPLSNENGNMPLNALLELIAERDTLAKDAERMRAALNTIARTPAMPFPDPGAHSARAYHEAVFVAWSRSNQTARAALAQIEQERSEQKEGA